MEKRVLYFDCFSGISGDMTVGALIDLGVDKDYLINELKKLNIDGYTLEIYKGIKKGIAGTRFNVILESEHHHCHHGEHEASHGHHHHHEAHNHNHEKAENHSHEHHSRNIKDIFEILDKSGLNSNIVDISKKIFNVIGEAEAKIHGKRIDEVHFHEVGAVDSIVDIVGTAICIDYLKLDEISASHINVGSGTVKCAHGIMPVPAPATVEILKGIPIYAGDIRAEMTTPTGAAIIKVLAGEFEGIPTGVIEAQGYGIGERELSQQANVLRVVLCKKKTLKSI